MPLFDQYTVDLVISGHNHCYERTLPIRAGQPTTDMTDQVDSSLGTTYITAGGGGASTSNYPFISAATTRVNDDSGQHDEPAPWRITRDRMTTQGVVCVDVAPASNAGGQSSLSVRTIDANGSQIDALVLRRTATIGSGIPDSGTTPAPLIVPVKTAPQRL